MESAQQQMPPQLHKSSEDPAADVASLGSAFSRGMTFSDDDLKNSDTFDVSVMPSSFLAVMVFVCFVALKILVMFHGAFDLCNVVNFVLC